MNLFQFLSHVSSEILNEMIQSIDREIENQTKTLINHKVFKAKLKQKELFTYKSEDSGLCGCCSCLPILR